LIQKNPHISGRVLYYWEVLNYFGDFGALKHKTIGISSCF